MARADLRTQFEKISDSAKTANDKIKAAGKKTRGPARRRPRQRESQGVRCCRPTQREG